MTGQIEGIRDMNAELNKMSSSQINESSDNRHMPQFEDKKSNDPFKDKQVHSSS